MPEKVTIDKSGANTAAVVSLVADTGLDIELRQSKYLNNLIEQDHQAIKRRARPMMGFASFHTAAKLNAGIETIHPIKKRQLGCHQGLVVSDADRFYSLATRRSAGCQPSFRRPYRDTTLWRAVTQGQVPLWGAFGLTSLVFLAEVFGFLNKLRAR